MKIEIDFYIAEEPWLSLGYPFRLLPIFGGLVAPQAASSESMEIPCKL